MIENYFEFFIILANSLKSMPDLVNLEIDYWAVYREECNQTLQDSLKKFHEMLGEMKN